MTTPPIWNYHEHGLATPDNYVYHCTGCERRLRPANARAGGVWEGMVGHYSNGECGSCRYRRERGMPLKRTRQPPKVTPETYNRVCAGCDRRLRPNTVKPVGVWAGTVQQARGDYCGACVRRRERAGDPVPSSKLTTPEWVVVAEFEHFRPRSSEARDALAVRLGMTPDGFYKALVRVYGTEAA